MRLVGIRDEPLSVDEVLAAVTDPAAGGVCLFVGTIRAEDDGRDVEGLGYSAHPSAAEALAAVCADVAARHDVIALAAVHRVGDLAVGDLATVVGGQRRAPRRGLRRGPGPDRHPEDDGADLEAPAVQRRRRRVGGPAVSSRPFGAPAHRRLRRRPPAAAAGGIAVVICAFAAVLCGAVIGVVPAPYAILGPGPGDEHPGHDGRAAADPGHRAPDVPGERRARLHDRAASTAGRARTSTCSTSCRAGSRAATR